MRFFSPQRDAGGIARPAKQDAPVESSAAVSELSAIQAGAVSMPPKLSQRERACLCWTARGKSSWEIGEILSISQNTVNFHIKNAMRKLETSSRTVAAIKAMQLGLIEPTLDRTAWPDGIGY